MHEQRKQDKDQSPRTRGDTCGAGVRSFEGEEVGTVIHVSYEDGAGRGPAGVALEMNEGASATRGIGTIGATGVV